VLDLIEQERRLAMVGGALLTASPEPLPETGKRRFGAVQRSIDRRVAELGREGEKKGRLPDLSRARQELDSCRGRLVATPSIWSDFIRASVLMARESNVVLSCQG